MSFRDHLRNKYLDHDPATKTWQDPDGDPVVLVAPSERDLEYFRDLINDDEVMAVEANARFVTRIAHAPQTDPEGQPVRRDGECVPGDRIFEEDEAEELTKFAVGHPIGELREVAGDWVRQLSDFDNGPSKEELRQFVERFVEMYRDPEADDAEKILANAYEVANGLVEVQPVEGNS